MEVRKRRRVPAYDDDAKREALAEVCVLTSVQPAFKRGSVRAGEINLKCDFYRRYRCR